jgi:hypothetical protein
VALLISNLISGRNRAMSLTQRRKLNLKAQFQSGPSYFSFKGTVPGAFSLDLIGSVCTALP